MKLPTITKIGGHTGLWLLFEAVWYWSLCHLHEALDVLVVKYDRAAGVDIYDLVTASFAWKSGWWLLVLVPLLAVPFVVPAWWRRGKFEGGWILILCVHCLGTLVAATLLFELFLYTTWPGI